jgi:hypothetical protein
MILENDPFCILKHKTIKLIAWEKGWENLLWRDFITESCEWRMEKKGKHGVESLGGGPNMVLSKEVNKVDSWNSNRKLTNARERENVLWGK